MDTAHGEHADHIHPNCKCHFMVRFSKEYDVEGYEPGKYKKICNWAKKNAKKEKDWVHVIERAIGGSDAFSVDQLNFMIDIMENPESELNISPQIMYINLQDLGFNVKPLGRSGSLSGISFENGGGYRVSGGGDMYFQYHPKEGSHHGDEYYRIASGKNGSRRFYTNGVEFYD